VSAVAGKCSHAEVVVPCLSLPDLLGVAGRRHSESVILWEMCWGCVVENRQARKNWGSPPAESSMHDLHDMLFSNLFRKVTPAFLKWVSQLTENNLSGLFHGFTRNYLRRHLRAESSPGRRRGSETIAKPSAPQSKKTVSAGLCPIQHVVKTCRTVATFAGSEARRERPTYTVYPRAPHVIDPAASVH
jgi:hypothetical protein